jgi:hypothetical protein
MNCRTSRSGCYYFDSTTIELNPIAEFGLLLLAFISPYANTCTAKAKAWSFAETPEDAAAKESVPEPSVVRTELALPSADGNTHTLFVVIDVGALNPT